MDGPKRLIDEGGTDDFERGLLDAANGDVGSPLALEKTFRLLELGGAVAAGAAATTTAASVAAQAAPGVTTGSAAAGATGAAAAGATGGAAATASGASAGSTIAAALGLKWIILGAVASGLAVGSLLPMRGDAPPPPAPSVAPVEVEAREAPRAASGSAASAASAPAITDNVSDAPRAPGARSAAALVEPSRPTPAAEPIAETAPAPAVPSTSDAAASAPSPSLSAEVALLERARAALRANDARRALAILDEHARDFSRGALLEEAAVFRIEALVALGDRAGAERAARPLLASSSPHASHIRALLQTPSAPPNP